jgi:pyruvate dehydrogenase E2 component (dihydrolipoamide acetyltransferase)
MARCSSWRRRCEPRARPGGAPGAARRPTGRHGLAPAAAEQPARTPRPCPAPAPAPSSGVAHRRCQHHQLAQPRARAVPGAALDAAGGHHAGGHGGVVAGRQEAGRGTPARRGSGLEREDGRCGSCCRGAPAVVAGLAIPLRAAGARRPACPAAPRRPPPPPGRAPAPPSSSRATARTRCAWWCPAWRAAARPTSSSGG